MNLRSVVSPLVLQKKISAGQVIKKIVPLSNSHSICELSTIKFLYQTIYINHHWLAGLGNEM